MTGTSLHDLNRQRKKKYYKDEKQENYLLEINKVLQKKEITEYLDLNEENPTIFVIGLPRSGTTLMTQLIAYSFDIGYINNFMARFWLSPVTGINLSKIIYDNNTETTFESEYAATQNIADIHEFGYFWRYWLKKDNISNIIRSKEKEKEINWQGLKKTILNIHHAFGKGWICKNIFGAYHIKKFLDVFHKSFFVYIERDLLDVAISIMDARRRFYDDPSIWWSTIPYEYPEIKDLSAEEQIAAQVFYLRKLYNQEIKNAGEERIIRVHYNTVTTKPHETIESIQGRVKKVSGIDIVKKPGIPNKFSIRNYNHRKKEKEMFAKLIKQFQ